MSKKNRKNIVYSTNPDFNYTFENDDGQDAGIVGKQQLKVFPDRKNRGGKTVTIVSGYKGSIDELKSLEKELKTLCGCGGTVKNREILIQGNMIRKISEFLKSKGHLVKIAGV